MFLYHKWLELPLQTRVKIANDFGIIKKTSTHVFNNVVQSDGYDIKDVEQALNLDALQKKFNTTETDLAVLWEWLVNGKPEFSASQGTEPISIDPRTISSTINVEKSLKSFSKKKKNARKNK